MQGVLRNEVKLHCFLYDSYSKQVNTMPAKKRDTWIAASSHAFWPALYNSRSCKRSGTLFKSLLFWLAGVVSWLAVEVLSPCQK